MPGQNAAAKHAYGGLNGSQTPKFNESHSSLMATDDSHPPWSVTVGMLQLLRRLPAKRKTSVDSPSERGARRRPRFTDRAGAIPGAITRWGHALLEQTLWLS